MPDDDITACLQAHAAARPTAPVFSAPSRMPMTWGSLAQRVRDARGRLASWGSNGDVLAAAVPDRVEWLPRSRSCRRRRRWRCSTDLGVDDFAALIRASGRRRPSFRRRKSLRCARQRVGSASPGRDGSRWFGRGGFVRAGTPAAAASLDGAARLDARWAYIGATSGTTGQPKLVRTGTGSCWSRLVRWVHGFR
jgi:hypothetical protein